MREKRVTMAHGSGGAATSELIRNVFTSEFDSEILDAMEDAAVLPIAAAGIVSDMDGEKRASDTIGRGDLSDAKVKVDAAGRLVMTTDSFVVEPVRFSGGDLGRLAVCGTVNDLLMRGAKPLYISSAWILEEGADIEALQSLVHSMAETAREAGVSIVCGDTKVIGGNGGIYANTTGIGIASDNNISASAARAGDVIIVSGTMGDHHAAILSERMSIDTDIKSDVAPLMEMVSKLTKLQVHTLRDVTRGGLATVLKELAVASDVCMEIDERKIPVNPKVRDFAKLLGLDPLYMGNEGKLVAIVAPEDATAALEAIKNSAYGENVAIIGEVKDSPCGELHVKTAIGGLRSLDVLQGEGLPRIC